MSFISLGAISFHSPWASPCTARKHAAGTIGAERRATQLDNDTIIAKDLSFSHGRRSIQVGSIENYRTLSQTKCVLMQEANERTGHKDPLIFAGILNSKLQAHSQRACATSVALQRQLFQDCQGVRFETKVTEQEHILHCFAASSCFRYAVPQGLQNHQGGATASTVGSRASLFICALGLMHFDCMGASQYTQYVFCPASSCPFAKPLQANVQS